MAIEKNVELVGFQFAMVSSANHVTPLPGLTVTAEITTGSAFAACTNSVAEIASGMYKITVTQTEMNNDILTLKFTATGADTRLITLITST